MKSKNICKFIPDLGNEKIEIHSFIFESDYNTIIKPSRLTQHRIILVRQGSGIFKFNEQEAAFEKGSLIFGFKNEEFSVKCKPGCEYMYIEFSGGRAELLFRRYGINRSNRYFSNFDGAIPLWLDSLSRASEESIDLASESMLLYTFSRLNAAPAAQNDLINRVLEITEQEFTNSELSLSVVADELTYNSKYLSHIFKEKMGIGYSEYVRTLRIKYAVSLFDHGIDSVKNVAYLSGFTDPLYFSSVFKKTVGVSPGEYKKRS